jgi:hypothetical protein
VRRGLELKIPVSVVKGRTAALQALLPSSEESCDERAEHYLAAARQSRLIYVKLHTKCAAQQRRFGRSPWLGAKPMGELRLAYVGQRVGGSHG